MNDKHTDDDLKSLWQDSEPVDIDALLAGVKKEQRTFYLYSAFDFVSTLLGVVLITWLYRSTELGVTAALYWSMIAFTLLYGFWVLNMRRGLWRSASQAPIDLIKLQRGRVNLNARLARLTYLSLPVATSIGFVMGRYLTPDDYESPFSDPVRYTIIGILLVTLVAVFFWAIHYERRKKAEIVELDQRITELEGSLENKN